MSPTANFDASTGNVYLSSDPSAVWNESALWGSSAVWGSSQSVNVELGVVGIVSTMGGFGFLSLKVCIENHRIVVRLSMEICI
jgi:hypothetical protein